MRSIAFLSLIPVAAGTAFAQGPQRVTTSIPSKPLGDSMRVMMIEKKRHLTPDEVRALVGTLKDQSAQLDRMRTEWQREAAGATPEWRRAMQEQLSRRYLELSRTQGTIAFACADLRPTGNEADGYVGISLEDTATFIVRAGNDPPVQKFFATPRVGEVKTGSPAAKAGVQPGDLWIAINGKQLKGSLVEELTSALKPGAHLELQLRRGDRDLDLSVTAEKWPEYPAAECNQASRVTIYSMTAPDAQAMIFPSPPMGKMPMRVQAVAPSAAFFTTIVNISGAVFAPLTAGKREKLGIKLAPGEGVLIDRVEDDSPASNSGLLEWDVVTHVNGQKVSTPADVLNMFRSVPGASSLTLTVVRSKDETKTITLSGR